MILVNTKELVQGFCISEKSACIIGCGGLGCNIAVHLAGAGIGKLFLCDYDTVSRGNLNRQFLYTEQDIGRPKCICAAEALSRYAPATHITAKNLKAEKPDDLLFASDCDILLLAVDNLQARKTVQAFAQKNKIPLVCGGIDGFYGMAYLYLPDCSPCPDCAGMNTQGKARYNVSATAGIIGSVQAMLAVRFLTTQDEAAAGKLIISDDGFFDTLQIRPSQDCKICRNIL